MLPFFHKQLTEFGVQSENECPVEESDLASWVRAGLNYGQSLLRNQPHIVKEIFGEYAPEHLKTLETLASGICNAAGGLKASWLIGPLLEWHRATFDWNKPEFYGHALTRVINLADFAIWLPWLLNGEPNMGGDERANGDPILFFPA
jgi:hypothetical protein